MRTTILLALVVAPLASCSCNQNPDEGPEADERDAGRVTLHRLNRAEYDNTVRDLLGTALTPAQDFPYDDSSHGFDNLAETLTMSPLHVEMYERAAEALATEALEIPLGEPAFERFEAEGPDVTATVGAAQADGWMLWSNGDLTATIEAPADGLYAIRTRLWATQAGPELAQAAIGHDGGTDLIVDVAATDVQGGETFEVEVQLTAGVHSIHVSFLNDFWDQYAGEDRNLIVDWIEHEGPLDLEPGPNPIRDRLLVCEPSSDTDVACARLVLEAFAPRAWRRPLEPGEVDGLLDVFDAVTSDGGTWDDGMRLAVQAVLLSPHFLFRVELEDEPGTEKRHDLTQYELATRLSYFLWSSMPDDALFAAAEKGELATEAQIAAQVTRMLADPKAEALTENFAGQWLYIRAIADKQPDSWEYPTFDEDLRDAMSEEMERFFRSFIDEERDLHELLLATEGEVNARLAEHYGLDPVGDWQTVDLEAADRGGLLAMSGLHLVNSYPARTSPVLRGKWVLSSLLCDEPPPPPPEVEGLITEDADSQTLREQLEQHRADPVCASCHDVMDPIGLSLEHFDGVGAWRATDNGFPVDASGELPDGTTFYGARELSAVIAADARYPTCITDKLFTYAHGRSPRYTDAPYLVEIEDAFAQGGFTFEALAVAIATSDTFRTRHGEAE